MTLNTAIVRPALSSIVSLGVLISQPRLLNLLLDAPFTAGDQSVVDGQVLDTSGEGVLKGEMLAEVRASATIAISSNKLVITGGGTQAWNTLWVLGRNADDSGFARADRLFVEYTIKPTTIGAMMVGWALDATVDVGDMRGALYILTDASMMLRENGGTARVFVGYAFTTDTYQVRCYPLTGGGFLWLVKGARYGTIWQVLGFTRTGADATLFQALTNFSGSHEFDSLRVVKNVTPPKLYYAYFNGAITSLTNYGIGVAAASQEDTGISLGRYGLNPIVSVGSGGTWDDATVKDPWVLKDGATWKMWYSGHDGSKYNIGYATSTDGLAWTKHGSNPVLTDGTAGAWDETHVSFPVVYKDNAADASKRYKMLYNGINASGHEQTGYAYSADGIAWTKGASNPVVAKGGAGAWDENSAFVTALVKDGSTYYAFYDGRTPTVGPPSEHQVGLVTFTDFEGTYTKEAGNPIIARRTGRQALTANLAAGGTSVSVASSAAFADNEVVMLAMNTTTGKQQNRIVDIPNSTTLTLEMPAIQAFNTADSAIIQTTLLAITPRFVVKENNKWRMWLTGFQAYFTTTGIAETTYYAESDNPDSGWAFVHEKSPPLWLSVLGREPVNPPYAWDSRSAENVMFALDADTMERVLVDP